MLLVDAIWDEKVGELCVKVEVVRFLALLVSSFCRLMAGQIFCSFELFVIVAKWQQNFAYVEFTYLFLGFLNLSLVFRLLILAGVELVYPFHETVV